MSVKDRLKSFLKHENIGQAKFSSIAGLSRGYVNNIVNTIGAEALHKISTAFPSLNTNWLLTGEGEMLIAESPTHTSTPQSQGGGISMPREVFEQMEKMIDTICSQQKTITEQHKLIERLTSAEIEKKSKDAM